MPRRTLRVRDANGQWVEVDPAKVRPPPIRRTALKKSMLERIALVHEALRDVMVAPNDQPLSLEQFEIGFMRSQSPAEELKVWEAIMLALDKAQNVLPPEQYERKPLYRRLILLLSGALTDEEHCEDETKMIMRCFHSSYPWPVSASPTQTAVTPTAPNGIAAGMCIVCFKSVGRAAAVFCPRCGHRLPNALSVAKGAL